MITYIHNESKRIDDETYIWFIGNCLSTDFKPVDKVYEASKLFELDTLKTYVYDSVTHTWQQVSCGGGSGSGGAFIIHDNSGTLDKTWNEIKNALKESVASIIQEDENGVYCALVGSANKEDDKFWVSCFNSLNSYSAMDEDGYPTSGSGPGPSPK